MSLHLLTHRVMPIAEYPSLRVIPNPWVWAIGRHMNQKFAYGMLLETFLMGPRFIILLGMRLKMWLRRARTRLQYRPGGTGYLRAREDFMIRAGQRRATRRYRPY